MTSFADPSNNQFASLRTMATIAATSINNTFKSVLRELRRNTKRIRHHSMSNPMRRVSFFADAEYLDKPAPSVTAIYTIRSATLIDSIKTKAEQDAEDAAAFAALTSSRPRWRPARERTKKIEQTDDDAFAELSFIPLLTDNLTNKN